LDLNKGYMPLESTLLVAHLSAVVHERLKSQSPDKSVQPPPPSAQAPLALMMQPCFMVEFQRLRKDYVSFFHLPESLAFEGEDVGSKASLEAQRALDELSAIMDLRSDANAILDEDVEQRWGHFLDDGKIASDDGHVAPAGVTLASAQFTGVPLEVAALARALTDHAVRTYRAELIHAPGAEQTRAALKEERLRNLSSARQVNAANRAAVQVFASTLRQSARSRYSQKVRDAFIGYPYVSFRRIDRNSDFALLCMATPLDDRFIDRRVPNDRRLPGVLLALFNLRGLEGQMQHFPMVERMLTNELGSLFFRSLLFQRSNDLIAAAGDATKISRYWFGKGVTTFLERLTNSAMQNESTVEFWARFVRELLCAKVEDVEDLETFPFDRAYVIPRTPTREAPTDGDLKILVLEAALQSTAAETRYQYLTSLERGDDFIIEDVNLADKLIKFSSELIIYPSGGGQVGLALDEISGAPGVETIGGADFKEKDADAIPVEKCLSSFLLAVAGANKSSKDGAEAPDLLRQAARDIRRAYDRNGFLYDFRAGVNLKEDAPLLAKLDEIYRRQLRARKLEGATQDDGQVGQTRVRDAKYVLISFEPELSEENRRSGGADRYYLPPEEGFTLILVADDDLEKGKQELDSEENDLRLLVNMVLRQKLRDRRREEQVVDRRVRLLHGMFDGLTHRLKSESELLNRRLKELGVEEKAQMRGFTPEAIRAIRENWEAMRDAMTFKAEALDKTEPTSRASDLFCAVWLSDQASSNTDSTSGRKGLNLREAEIRQSILDRIAELAAALNANPADIQLEMFFDDGPVVQLEAPLKTLREAVDVLLKNAVEHSILMTASLPRRVRLSVALVERAKDDWALVTTVLNATDPVPDGVLERLNASEPQSLDPNERKPMSTGIGVQAARMVLQTVLGNGADIRYNEVDDHHLQARMTVPVRLATRKKDSVESLPSAPMPNSDQLGLLYLEDSPDHFAPSLEAMRPLAGWTVAHTTSLAGVRALALQQPWRLMVSDLTVPRDEAGGVQAAQPKHGRDALIFFQNAASHWPTKPSIWIVSSGSAGDISKDMRMRFPAEAGYTVGVITNLEVAPSLAPGAVSILPVKSLADYPAAIGALRSITHGRAPEATAVTKTAQEISTHPMPRTGNGAPKVMRAALNVEAIRNVAGEWLADAEALLLTEAPSDMTLETALDCWFQFEGIKDRDSLDETANLAPLWNSTMHQQVVLRLPSAALRGAVQPQLRHWVLRYNIAFVDDPEFLVANWGGLRREESGPLARIRHDLNNIRPKEIDPSAQAEILLQLKEFEVMLHPPASVIQALDAEEWLHSSPKQPGLHAAILQPEDAEHVEACRRQGKKLLTLMQEFQNQLSQRGAHHRAIQELNALVKSLRVLLWLSGLEERPA
jgi:hypothetical protein